MGGSLQCVAEEVALHDPAMGATKSRIVDPAEVQTARLHANTMAKVGPDVGHSSTVPKLSTCKASSCHPPALS